MAKAKPFVISQIKHSKNEFNLCPKFKEFMFTHGNSRSAYRTSPISFQVPIIELPRNLDNSISRYLRDEVVTVPKTLKLRAALLNRTLWLRSMILEDTLKSNLLKIEHIKLNESMEKYFSNLTENDIDEMPDSKVEAVLYGSYQQILQMKKKEIQKHVNLQLKTLSTPIQYSSNLATLYLISRIAPNFSTICKILFEIRKRCPKFNPVNMLDFGSGTGSATWAANSIWNQGCLQQHVLVDASVKFLNIAEYLLKDGIVNQDHNTFIPNVYFRAYLSSPKSEMMNDEVYQYDLVISAFSLLDISGGYKNRRDVLDNLWEKTRSNGGFLVIAELGTKDGFLSILEARDWLLKKEGAKIFSPCPHSFKCPKADFGCKFYTKYQKLSLTESHSDVGIQKYSYVVISKGDISQYQDASEYDIVQYPRIVTHSPKSEYIQDLCHRNGEAQRYRFASKSGPWKMMLKSCQPGDFMPVHVVNKEIEENNNKFGGFIENE